MARTALRALGTSIFSEMTALAQTHGAVNLSQGFPDFDGDVSVVRAAEQALRDGHNQYGRSQGVAPLAHAIARHDARFFGLSRDPMTELCCTTGATEAIAATMLGLLDPGDDVLLFQPHYDAYPAAAAMAGATTTIATLHAPLYELPIDQLDQLVNKNTKMVVVTHPHNPTGRVFSDRELTAFAAFCHRHDLLVISDEVYAHLVYDDRTFRPLCTFPSMWDRTITVSSTGKTLSFTGWKVGWAAGPKNLIDGVQRAHQFLTFCGPTPLMVAMADGLDAFGLEAAADFRRAYARRRDRLMSILRSTGFVPVLPEGAYFVMANICGVTSETATDFARRLVVEAGVASIPPRAFYTHAHDDAERMLRFAFCKRDETLDEAARRLLQFSRR
jgi:N-succinyldiaminopimelate aminotransferase